MRVVNEPGAELVNLFVLLPNKDFYMLTSEVAYDNCRRRKKLFTEFDRGDSSLECFNRTTHNYGL